MGICLFLVWTSSWLKGRAWFVATVLVLASSLVALEWDSPQPTSTLDLWLTRGGLSFVFLSFFYLIGGRFITATAVTDMTYQSHEALSRFIDASGDNSLFARILRNMGPALFVALLLFGVVVVLAKFTGAVE